MDEFLVISILGGLAASVLALGIGWFTIRLYSNSLIKSIDVNQQFEQLSKLKRDSIAIVDFDESGTAVTVPKILSYGVVVAAITTTVLRVSLLLWSDLRIVAITGILIWLFLVFLPVVRIIAHRTRQLIILEIALILEKIAQSMEEMGEVWSLRSSKRVSGGDLFGADEEDRLELFISRVGDAPVTLSVSGKVSVAETGLDRTLNKKGLRQLRLKGWYVNEIDDNHAEIKFTWSLRENTYIHIAHDLTAIIETLKFPARNVMLTGIESEHSMVASQTAHLQHNHLST